MNSENRQTLYAIRPYGPKARAHTSYLVFKNAEARRDWVDKLNNDLDNWRMYVGVIGVVENLYPGDKDYWARPIRKDGKGLKAHEIGANDSRQIGSQVPHDRRGSVSLAAVHRRARRWLSASLRGNLALWS